MARSFATGNYLLNSVAGFSGGKGSLFLRVRPSWSGTDSATHMLVEYESDTSNYVSFQKFSDNNVYVGWVSGADYRMVFSASGLFTASVWGNWLLTWDDAADQQEIFHNDTSVGSNSATFTEATIDSVGVGASSLFPGGGPADADIAEIGRWSRVLTAAERAILQLTGCPLSVPRGLLRYYPLIGSRSPEVDLVGGENLTLVGTPAAAPHPRIFLPYSQADYFGSSLTHYTLTASPGAFTLTGQSANLLYGRRVSADPGAYAETGQAATLLYNRTLAADFGAFAETGQAAALLYGRKFAADTGSYALTGTDASFNLGFGMVVDPGSFTETGADATLLAARSLSASFGSFTLTGQDADLTQISPNTGGPIARVIRIIRPRIQ